MKKFILFSLLVSFTACTAPTKQTIDMTKLRDEDRVYTGVIQVDLNGKKNPDLTCDLFMNSDIAATIRLSADGEYLFKTNKKKLAFTRIACLHTVEKKQRWVQQRFSIPRIKQPDESKAKEVFNMGTLEINWTIKDSEFEKSSDIMDSQDPMASAGKIQIKTTP